MSDPYKVLGVSPNISDEELKRVYRDLARKYHPDSYMNNPLADLAGDKMKEINEAYDTIQQMRKKQGTGYGSSTQSGGWQGGYSAPNQFADIRRMVQSGRMADAEELLNGVPEAQRDGEWYFLKGNIFYSRGWLEEALRCFNTAVQMSPGNPEYQAAVQQMMWQRRTAAPQGYSTQQGGGCSPCNVCAGLMCADCCCECMGGDLIRCF